VVELELLVPDVRRLNVAGGASTVVMNPNSGPGSAPIPDYQRVIDYCHARGQHVIAYVHTSYGGRTAAAVKADIDTSYAFYPGIDGIFLDEMSNAASTRSYYQYLYAAIKAKPGVRDVVGNPGAAASTSWQLDTPVADEVVVFEGPAANYQRWTAPPWTAAKPASRLVHIVYAAATASAMQQTCSRSKRLNAGLVYVADDTLPNPWDTLPAGAYWTSEIVAC